MVRRLNTCGAEGKMKNYNGTPVRQSLTFIVTYDSFPLSSDAYISLCYTYFFRLFCCKREAIKPHIFR